MQIVGWPAHLRVTGRAEDDDVVRIGLLIAFPGLALWLVRLLS